jgi:hypothetical protein
MIGTNVISGATPSHGLAESISDAIAAGTFNARVIGTQRDMVHVKKLLRLRRADGEEFAIEYVKNGFQVWSSVHTDERPGLTVKSYGSDKTRHSNLGCMEKLRGPNKKEETLGVCAWKLRFSTLEAARTFIVSTS